MADWRDRLREVFEADGRSMRRVSLDAELAENYLHGVLKMGKEPSASAMIKLARALQEPIGSLFEEADKDEARQRLLRIADKLSPEQLRFLERMALDLASGVPQLHTTGKSDKP